MKTVKRIEIIIPAVELKKMLRLLKESGVSGYTVIRSVTGFGDRGEQTGDELTGVFDNACVLTLAEPEKAAGIVERIRAVLKRHGGVCVVSDADWVIH
jgi:nitrogen regulatory protein PII